MNLPTVIFLCLWGRANEMFLSDRPLHYASCRQAQLIRSARNLPDFKGGGWSCEGTGYSEDADRFIWAGPANTIICTKNDKIVVILPE